MHFAARGDRRLHYALEGAPADPASTLILIPGIGSGMKQFGTLPRRFARQGWRCVTYDPVGVAPSSPHDSADYDFAAAADDLWAVLDAAGVQQAHLVGTSLGGKVGLTAAARAPTRTRSLVMLASAAVVSARARCVYRFFETVAAKLDEQDFGTAIAPFLFGDNFHATRPQLVEDIVRAVRPTPGTRRLMVAQARELQRFDGAAMARAWPGPTLCMVGRQDTLTGLPEVQATAALCRDARYVEIADAGHSLLLESARAFDEVIAFLGVTGQR